MDGLAVTRLVAAGDHGTGVASLRFRDARCQPHAAVSCGLFQRSSLLNLPDGSAGYSRRVVCCMFFQSSSEITRRLARDDMPSLTRILSVIRSPSSGLLIV